MQQRHTAVISESKQQQLSKRMKITELKDLILEIQVEIQQALEQQGVLMYYNV
jgi:hypothetical protein